jgi:hypothetical protein
MTIFVDILNEEQLDREVKHIKSFMRKMSKEEFPLCIEWGTKQAFEGREEALSK